MPNPNNPEPTWQCSRCGKKNKFDTAICKFCGRFFLKF